VLIEIYVEAKEEKRFFFQKQKKGRSSILGQKTLQKKTKKRTTTLGPFAFQLTWTPATDADNSDSNSTAKDDDDAADEDAGSTAEEKDEKEDDEGTDDDETAAGADNSDSNSTANSTTTDDDADDGALVPEFNFQPPNVTGAPLNTSDYMVDSNKSHVELLKEVIPVKNFTKPKPEPVVLTPLQATQVSVTNFALKQLRCVAAVAAHILYAGKSSTNATATISAAKANGTVVKSLPPEVNETVVENVTAYDACASDQLSDIHARADGFEKKRIQAIVAVVRRRVKSFVMSLDSLDPSVRVATPCPAKGCDSLSDDVDERLL
jgi:hypothetical protein